MQNRGQLYLGLTIIILGGLLLIGNLTDLDVGALCWPSAIILLGVWLLLRPRMVGDDVAQTQKLIGDIDRRGDWSVQTEDFLGFVLDSTLDLTQADIPMGETRLRFYAFVCEVDLFVPADVGVRLQPTAFVSEINLDGHKSETILGNMPAQTDHFDKADRRIVVESVAFVTELDVRRINVS